MERFSFNRKLRTARTASGSLLRARLRAGIRAMPLLLAMAATACSSVMTANPSGFLSTYDGLSVTGDPSAARRASGPVDPSQVTLAEVQWRAPERADIVDEERRALSRRLEAAIRQEVDALPPVSNGRAVMLRAAITRVEPVSPALNTVSALVLFVPLDRGGAAVEIEAIDAQTGQQLAALNAGYFSSITELVSRFSKLAPAENALKKAAVEFARLLRAS
ncbi:DUF3313 family protein [Variovorax sp. OV329]|uniref:DUF3313 family protein n=1 Tax=Variovorax sp. OV329 TaxID=1882825 RepID=UPI0008ED7E24|nr:DUF3313 family protein [Variovorax sp. OV329]SFM64573.1 Protein of unknown function [Variovorax sp. OV329]